jgi:hypothetical protein
MNVAGYKKETKVHLDSTGISVTLQERLPEKVIRVFEAILEDLQMDFRARRYQDLYVSGGILWGTKR